MNLIYNEVQNYDDIKIIGEKTALGSFRTSYLINSLQSVSDDHYIILLYSL